ncbi:MAG: Oxidoreductase, molybdopterin-binding domain-containing protein [Olpidium bornovanus]|uniref:Oxidoreductase, molybdopterin-binding domain-containing protein n=1 Tax=Olpidium bornovanus TaxID=278681 RepID=A0A8H8A0R5_9FUNG|nr:MAG: Oxidoreductase, molybdopterin-binding domain-containing protein [Olpidium bornovanus]
MAFDADDWIRRDDRLVARTGRLPFNAEPPPATLLAGGDEGGAVTPAALHYVRNHAPVPRLEWAEHVLEVADDSSTVMLPMDALRDLFRPVDVLVTFACDGNRRGELNGIRRTLGFDFGPCAVSTGSWAGALLRDVLLRFFGERALDRYNYVCFEGCDALTNGTYGTSIPVALVKDPTTDVLVAYSLNGAAIPPDHGFPVRTIIPGFVGGRTVKWLKKIRLSKKESQSWYHFYDNRLLPSPVTSEGIATQYWKNPDYLIYEMNLNSVMLAPGHDEELKIGCLESLVHLQGYAYDGGGRRITRVELSLDDGQTWLLCDHQYPDGYHPRHGKRWWVMCKWSYSVEMYKLAIAKEIIVRAWNISHNTQPERRTWWAKRGTVSDDVSAACYLSHACFGGRSSPGTSQG